MLVSVGREVDGLHVSPWSKREGASKVEVGAHPTAQPRAGDRDLGHVGFLQQDSKSQNISAGGTLVSHPLLR